MEAFRIRAMIQKDGEITVTGLPFKRGQEVELIIQTDVPEVSQRPCLTAKQLLASELIGIWREREDVEDSVGYARQLREQAQRR
jgi:hypothetical protein